MKVIPEKIKDRVTRTPLKTGGELRCSGRVSSSCSTSDTRTLMKKKIEKPNDLEIFGSMKTTGGSDSGIFKLFLPYEGYSRNASRAVN
jgi:hypothetical protein